MGEISLDELLEKITEVEKEGGKSSDFAPIDQKIPRSVTDFVKTFEIKDGLAKVPAHKFYYDYMCWDRFNSTKLSKIEFGRQMAKLFESGRGNKGRYWLLDDEAFELDNESLTRSKKYDIMYQGKKTK